MVDFEDMVFTNGFDCEHALLELSRMYAFVWLLEFSCIDMCWMKWNEDLQNHCKCKDGTRNGERHGGAKAFRVTPAVTKVDSLLRAPISKYNLQMSLILILDVTKDNSFSLV